MLREDIIKYLNILNDKLKKLNVKGEICLYGGAVMCLVYDARPSTKDVDAIFHPAQIIRMAAREIAKELDLADDWLNDGVKGFLVEHPRKVFLNLSNLTILAADTEYLLAMKLLASRVDGTDKKDIEFLIKELKIDSVNEAITVIEKYYPNHLIKPATMFFLEELYNEKQNS